MNETNTVVLEKMVQVTKADLEKRKQEWAEQVTRTYTVAKQELDRARSSFELAKCAKARLAGKVTVNGTAAQYKISDIEAVNDLISDGDIFGRDAVDAVISCELIEIVAATIRFTRNKQASFVWINADLVRVSSPGR